MFARSTLFTVLFAALALPGCGSDSSSPEAGALPVEPTDPGAVDALPDAAPAPQPIDAPAGEWTWVPFADTSCANGKPTGLGINPGKSKRLVVYLEGGGACWSSITCYTLKTASHMETGYRKSDFESAIRFLQGSLFDRESDANAFRDASYVYIPYCTGDVHAGDKELDYDGEGTVTHHVGRRNLEAFLKRIVPTFPDVERITLAGSSAGGFGAALNYWRVREAFGASKRVDLVDDSGPPLPSSKSLYIDSWRESWNLDAALPPDCAGCKDDLSAVLPYYFGKYADARFAVLSYTEDSTIRQFFGLDGPGFAKALDDLRASLFDPSKNGRMFRVAGPSHVLLTSLGVHTAGGDTLGTWLTAMDSDAPWSNVGP